MSKELKEDKNNVTAFCLANIIQIITQEEFEDVKISIKNILEELEILDSNYTLLIESVSMIAQELNLKEDALINEILVKIRELNRKLENNISKDTIKEKIEELSQIRGDFATYIAISEKIKVLEELLEESEKKDEKQ